MLSPPRNRSKPNIVNQVITEDDDHLMSVPDSDQDDVPNAHE